MIQGTAKRGRTPEGIGYRLNIHTAKIANRPRFAKFDNTKISMIWKQKTRQPTYSRHSRTRS